MGVGKEEAAAHNSSRGGVFLQEGWRRVGEGRVSLKEVLNGGEG